jgi:two-component system, NtrC family, sensor kinase
MGRTGRVNTPSILTWPRRLAERFGGSVRAKLLALVLAPLCLGVPVLLGLVWSWGNEAYHRLLTFKIDSDLVTAHEYFDRVKQGITHDLQAQAGSARLTALLPAHDPARLGPLLAAMASTGGLDYLLLLDRNGHAIAGSPAAPLPKPARDTWPAVSAAIAGSTRSTVEVFSPQALAAVDPALRKRAYLPLVATPAAAPDTRSLEERGLMIHAAAPVFDERGLLIGVLEGGVLLNGNLGIVDRINAIVYRDGSLPLDSRGTSTLFLGDTRIATNVRLFEGQRALGTRVSAAVRKQVLEEGRTWRDLAFVVSDYYVSGYEPILDSHGERVGMLYVGFLEAPFRIAKERAMGTLFLIFVVVSAIGSALSLGWARSVFRPIERMNDVIQRVEGGDPAARVGPVTSRDEIGRLAVEFDHLLDTQVARQAELHRWANELDRKVAERSAQLADTSASLSKAQQQLVMSDKLAAIGELTAGVAHEINNPVAVIQGNLDVLTDTLGETARPVREEIRLIHQQADRIRQIVTRLLQFARPGDFAGYIETVNVNEVINDCLVLTRHNLDHRKIELERRLHAEVRVEINRGELQQVLINLIVNATQAMPDGGRLSLLSADWMESGQPAGVRIDVRDTGQGIAAHDLERIFDPFFTTKKGKGTGLGLSISHTLMQRYGGRISAASRTGEGAEFTLWLRSTPDFDSHRGLPTAV